jgi:hypothetical protein
MRTSEHSEMPAKFQHRAEKHAHKHKSEESYACAIVCVFSYWLWGDVKTGKKSIGGTHRATYYS